MFIFDSIDVDEDDVHNGDGDDGDGGENEWWRNWKGGRRFHRSSLLLTDEAVKYAKYLGSSAPRMLNTVIMNRVIRMTIMMVYNIVLPTNKLSQWQDRYNSEESLEEENQSTTSSTESRQSDFAKKEEGFIPTRRYTINYNQDRVKMEKNI